jgi:excisionase family DNA binding protein
MVKLKKIMLVKDVAQFLGVHPLTVQKYARCGKIPGFKIGTQWRFDSKHIRKWLKDRSIALDTVDKSTLF